MRDIVRATGPWTRAMIEETLTMGGPMMIVILGIGAIAVPLAFLLPIVLGWVTAKLPASLSWLPMLR